MRRAKLYYLRERHGKAAKIKEHRSGKPSEASRVPGIFTERPTPRAGASGPRRILMVHEE